MKFIKFIQHLPVLSLHKWKYLSVLYGVCKSMLHHLFHSKAEKKNDGNVIAMKSYICSKNIHLIIHINKSQILKLISFFRPFNTLQSELHEAILNACLNDHAELADSNFIIGKIYNLKLFWNSLYKCIILSLYFSWCSIHCYVHMISLIMWF